MMPRRTLGAAVALLIGTAGTLSAQAFAYPSFQTGRITQREYNFFLGDADGGTSSIGFQWREGLGNPKLQFTLDAGLGDAGPETAVFFGGGIGYQITRSSTDMPFDIVLVGSLGLTFAGGENVTRVPLGASLGRRFPLDGGFAISPYLAPRLAWTRFSAVDASDTNLEVEFGGSFEFNPRMAIRLALVSSDADAVGISFAWTPRGMR
jgi:hypothetical protein